MSLEVLLFIIFNGLLYGMFLFMLSSGLTLIFGMMGILNFAHASFFMIGAYRLSDKSLYKLLDCFTFSATNSRLYGNNGREIWVKKCS